MKSWGFVSLPTGIHLVVSGQLVEVSFSVSMSPRGVIVVVGSVYSLSDPLLLFGFLWFTCLVCALCVFITAGPITKLFAGGEGGEWRTCAMIDDEPRPVWMSAHLVTW